MDLQSLRNRLRNIDESLKADALNRLTGFLPENLLTKLRYLLFKHLQHSGICYEIGHTV